MNKRNSHQTPDKLVRLLCLNYKSRPFSYIISLAGVLLTLLISTFIYAGTSAEEVTTTLGKDPLIQSFSAQGSDLTTPPPDSIPPGVPDPPPISKPSNDTPSNAKEIKQFAITTRGATCSNLGLIDFWNEQENKTYYDVYNLPLASIPNPIHQMSEIPRYRFSKQGLSSHKELMDEIIKPLPPDASDEDKDKFENSRLKMSLIYWTTALHYNSQSLAKTYKIPNSEFYRNPHLFDTGYNKYSQAYLQKLQKGMVGVRVRSSIDKQLKFDANILDITDEKSVFYKKDNFNVQTFKFDSKPSIFLPQVIGATDTSGVARYNTIGVGSARTSTSRFALVPLTIKHFSTLIRNDATTSRAFYGHSKKSMESSRYIGPFNKILFRAYEVLAFQDASFSSNEFQRTPWRAAAHRPSSIPQGLTSSIKTNLYQFDNTVPIDTPPMYITHFAVQTCREFQSPEPLKDPYILNITRKDNLQALDVINDMRALIARADASEAWSTLSDGAGTPSNKFTTRISGTDLSSFYGSFYGSNKKLHTVTIDQHVQQFKARASTLGLDSSMKGNYISAFHWFYLYTQAIKTTLDKVYNGAKLGAMGAELSLAINAANTTLPADSQKLTKEDITCSLSQPTPPTPPAADASPEQIATYNAAQAAYDFNLAAYTVAEKFCPTLRAVKNFMQAYTKALVIGAKDSTAAKTGPSLLRLATLNVAANTETGLSPYNPLKFGGMSSTETSALPIKAVPTLYKALSCFEIKNSLAKLYRSYKNQGTTLSTIAADSSLDLGSTSYKVKNPISAPTGAPQVTYVGNSHKWWEHTDFGFECAYLEKHLLKMHEEDKAPYTLFHLLSGLVYDDNYPGAAPPFHDDHSVETLLAHWSKQQAYVSKRLTLIDKAVRIDNLGIILNLQHHHTKSCTHQVLTSTIPTQNDDWGKLQSSAILDMPQRMADADKSDYPFQQSYNSTHIEYDFAVNQRRQQAYRNPYYATFATTTPFIDVSARIDAQQKSKQSKDVPLGQPLLAIPGMPYRSPAFLSQPSKNVWVTMSPRAICHNDIEKTWIESGIDLGITTTLTKNEESIVSVITDMFKELSKTVWFIETTTEKEAKDKEKKIKEKCSELMKRVKDLCKYDSPEPRCANKLTQEFCEKVPENFSSTTINIVN